MNKFKSLGIFEFDEINISKFPIIIGIILVYISTVFTENIYRMSLKTAIWFTIVMIVHLLLYLFSNIIFKNRYWIYFVVQGVIVFDCAIIMPNLYESAFLGIIPVLIIQSMIVYNDVNKVIITAFFFYSIFCGTIFIFNGINELIKSIPILVIITISMCAYAFIFFKQIKLRSQTQKVLKKLELAYEKVEELTLINERQRMARDLHDTLSQGLVGIIMQLDSVNANLNNNNIKRAQEIIEKSMEHARKTLSDSRRVINDLRFKTNESEDFVKAVENEIDGFKAISNIYITTDIKIESHIPLGILKHILYILREVLNNIAKHAKAKNASIEIIENKNQININIIDDGIGFDIKLLDKLFGHYGILGMTERVKIIHGEIKIKSKRKFGTNISVVIPIREGINK